jgi:hypothetical protein
MSKMEDYVHTNSQHNRRDFSFCRDLLRPVSSDFPQFVDGVPGGGFWASVIAVTNAAAVGTPAASGTVTVTKPDGTPLNVTFFDENGRTPQIPFNLRGANKSVPIADFQWKSATV